MNQNEIAAHRWIDDHSDFHYCRGELDNLINACLGSDDPGTDEEWAKIFSAMEKSHNVSIPEAVRDFWRYDGMDFPHCR
jgi:hypothetical protein